MREVKAGRTSKSLETVVIIIMTGMLVILLVMCYLMYTKLTQPMQVHLDGYSLANQDAFQGDLKDFLVLSKHFANNHKYVGCEGSNGTCYNCQNYTQDLYNIAEQLGFKVTKVRGWQDRNQTGHAWLRLSVDFEPQSSTFQDYSKVWPDQEEYK